MHTSSLQFVRMLHLYAVDQSVTWSLRGTDWRDCTDLWKTVAEGVRASRLSCKINIIDQLRDSSDSSAGNSGINGGRNWNGNVVTFRWIWCVYTHYRMMKHACQLRNAPRTCMLCLRPQYEWSSPSWVMTTTLTCKPMSNFLTVIYCRKFANKPIV